MEILFVPHLYQEGLFPVLIHAILVGVRCTLNLIFISLISDNEYSHILIGHSQVLGEELFVHILS